MTHNSDSPLVLGVDIGTRTVRVGVFDSTGELICLESASYEFHQSGSGWAEQDPHKVWKATVEALRRTSDKNTAIVKRIVALSISGTAVTLVSCDGAGSPLESAMLWMDIRARREAQEISESKSDWLDYTGGQVSAEWMLPMSLRQITTTTLQPLS